MKKRRLIVALILYNYNIMKYKISAVIKPLTTVSGKLQKECENLELKPTDKIVLCIGEIVTRLVNYHIIIKFLNYN